MDSIGICIPTYNEADNLPVLIDRIRRALPQALIWIVDDNSPDGTGHLALRMASDDKGLHVISRAGKSGLGNAYREGFRQILTDTGIFLIVQMDADLSHPVDCLPRMIAKAQAADLVIGSRYVPGGRIENWPLARRLLSRFGSLYARGWLGLPVNDLTGGFKVWHREMLARVLENPVTSSGYVFQIEMTYRAHGLGARIAEVPITFTERNHGQSKMSLAIAMEACWRVPGLRLGKRHH
jgi:dolichol-phosphate mannosyltransferase